MTSLAILGIVDFTAWAEFQLISSWANHKELAIEGVQENAFRSHGLATEKSGSATVREFWGAKAGETSVAQSNGNFDVMSGLLTSATDS